MLLLRINVGDMMSIKDGLFNSLVKKQKKNIQKVNELSKNTDSYILMTNKVIKREMNRRW